MKGLAKMACRVLLGKGGKKAFDIGAVKTILILRNDKIGDMIISTPLFRELKKRHPGVAIDVVASSGNADIVRDNPHVRDVIIWDEKQGAGKDFQTIWAIRRRAYDVIFSTSNRFSIPFLMRIKLLGAKYLIGFKIARYRTNTAELGMYDYTVDCVRSEPLLRSYFAAFGQFGLAPGLESEPIDARYELFGVEVHAAKAWQFFAALRKEYRGAVCFNGQGSGSNRTIAVEDAARLCAGVADQHPDHAVIVTFAPEGKARASEIVKRSARPNVRLSFDTGHVLELAALVRECDLLISPDTSLIHMASTYNKKILGFYINTDNFKWFYPASDKYIVMLAKTEEIGRIDTAAALRAVDELMAA